MQNIIVYVLDVYIDILALWAKIIELSDKKHNSEPRKIRLNRSFVPVTIVVEAMSEGLDSRDFETRGWKVISLAHLLNKKNILVGIVKDIIQSKQAFLRVSGIDLTLPRRGAVLVR